MKKDRKKMRKFIKSVFCVCMMVMMLPILAFASEDTLDTSFSMHYGAGQTYFEFYKVASFSETGVFEVEEPFTKYVGEITGLDKLDEMDAEGWSLLASSLDKLVVTEGMEPTKIFETNEEGNFYWDNIPKGLYLIVGDPTMDEEKIYTPNPTLITVPNRDVDGNWNSYVEVEHTKYAEEDVKEYTDLEVEKIWEDNNDEYKKRTEEIIVSLYKGEEKVESVPLNKENNWTYTWDDLEIAEDIKWSIKEEDVPEGYTSAISEEGMKIRIINTYHKETSSSTSSPTTSTPSGRLPQTGQLWWPVPFLAILGIAFFAIGWVRRNSGER